MKKLFLSFAVIASVALFSCGGNKAEKEEATEPETEVVAEQAGEAEEVAECCDSTQQCAEGAAVEEAAVAETPAAE